MIYIIAGEPSGDLHGSRLARALRLERPDLRLKGLGGGLMAEAGVELLEDVAGHASMGLVEVAGQIGYYIGLLKRLAERIRADKPEAVVLIDFPDFNLRLAERLAGSGIPVLYYIAPQVWAWRSWRVRQIRRTVRKVLVIFPFEEEYYRSHGVETEFVGHPLIGLLAEEGERTREEAAKSAGLDPSQRWVGIFPGSRRGVFKRLWPPFRDAARIVSARFPEVRFAVATAPSLGNDWIDERMKDAGLPMTRVAGHSRDVMRVCEAAFIASGTATLEAGLLELPFVMAYRFNWITALIGLLLIRKGDYAMPNILAGKRIAPEFIQHRATPKALAAPIVRWLENPAERQRVKADLARLKPLLGTVGASRRAARAILTTAGAPAASPTPF